MTHCFQCPERAARRSNPVNVTVRVISFNPVPCQWRTTFPAQGHAPLPLSLPEENPEIYRFDLNEAKLFGVS